MTKKCSVCGRKMAEHECGDELPEERVCDECAGIAPECVEPTLATSADIAYGTLREWSEEV